jgi:RNA polymerase sigma-70 factor (ECF subfamily)
MLGRVSERASPVSASRAVGDPSRDLALRAAGGDRDALEALLREQAPKIAALCHHLMGHHPMGAADGHDAAQEALFKVVRELGRFDPERGTFSAWAQSVARNVCRDRLRRRGLERRTFEKDGTPHEERAESGEADPERRAIVTEDAELLGRALQGLPEPMREAILMFHVAELSYEQIARELDVPMGTVMTWLHRGRKRLRAAIEEP